MTILSRLETRLAVSYLNCPRCGLSIKLRAPWLTIRHCPRCVARSRTVVELFESRLPVESLYAADPLLYVGAKGRAEDSPDSTRLDGRDSR